MSLVTLMMSYPGRHSQGLILGNPESVVYVEETDLGYDSNTSGNGEPWVDSGLVIQRRKRTYAPDNEHRLLIVLASGAVFLKQMESLDAPSDDLGAIPIPVLQDTFSGYACLLHPDTKSVWLKMPVPPDEEPAQPWWRAFWPF